jgi:thiol-disulfide isomerase/thioredoxin
VLRPATVACALAFALLVAGCGDDDAVPGGAGDLPGPLPSGVSFQEPPGEALAAPDFSAALVDGTPVRASELWDDRPLVLVFTASWCGTCADVHRGAARVVAGQEGAVGLLGVVPADDGEPAREYAAELDLGHPLAVAEEDVWLDYAAREPPLVALVAPGGRILRGWPGGVDEAVLARELDALVER